MYRRIELIDEHIEKTFWACKHGLMGFSELEVALSWIDDLSGFRHRFSPRCRFWFTELGWQKVGRKVVAACMKTGQKYRIIAVKHRDLDVERKNAYEVVAMPRKKRPRPDL